jgi:hypothetical protein
MKYLDLQTNKKIILKRSDFIKKSFKSFSKYVFQAQNNFMGPKTRKEK